MTSEHVWGQWLRPYLRNDLNKHQLHRRIVGKAGIDRTGIRIRAGGPLTSSVSVVCEPCNTQWLSGIQSRAKSHLVPLIEGRETLIGEAGEVAVAKWATMATMTGEYTLNNLASIGVSQEDRTSFMHTLAPLPEWRIWIGTYRRVQWQGNWVHASMPILREGDLIIPNVQERDVPLSNTQWTTVMIGELYIHAASSSTSPDYIKAWNWGAAPRAKQQLVQIWPIKEKLIKWPFLGSLTDRDAWHFSQAQFHRLDALHRARSGTA